MSLFGLPFLFLQALQASLSCLSSIRHWSYYLSCSYLKIDMHVYTYITTKHLTFIKSCSDSQPSALTYPSTPPFHPSQPSHLSPSTYKSYADKLSTASYQPCPWPPQRKRCLLRRSLTNTSLPQWLISVTSTRVLTRNLFSELLPPHWQNKTDSSRADCHKYIRRNSLQATNGTSQLRTACYRHTQPVCVSPPCWSMKAGLLETNY